jgi:hypothetical protein
VPPVALVLKILAVFVSIAAVSSLVYVVARGALRLLFQVAGIDDDDDEEGIDLSRDMPPETEGGILS